MLKNKQPGFTLIELLIVIAVLAILATVVFVGLDPLSRFQDTRNSKRSTDTNQILSAIKLSQVDNKGLLIESIEGGEVGVYYMIGNNTVDCTTACVFPDVTTNESCIDLSGLVNGGPGDGKGGYLPSVPIDPKSGTVANTGYYLYKNANKTITVGACNEEEGSGETTPDLSATR